MKRILCLVLSVLMLCSLFVVPVSAADEAQTIKIYVDGREVEIKEVPLSEARDEQQPYLENGRTLVPLRAIGESLNNNVGYDGNTQKISLKNKQTEFLVELQIGNTTMTLTPAGGTPVTKTLDVPPVLVKGRTMVPVRAIAEAFGTNVTWLESSRQVLITTHKEKYHYIYPYVNGYACAYTKERKWDIFKWDNTHKIGNLVCENLEFDVIFDFFNDMACVKKDGKYGFINTTGALVIDTKYVHADDFEYGFVKVTDDTGSQYYINKKGERVFDTYCEPLDFFNGDVHRVMIGSEVRYVDENGVLLYDAFFHDGLFANIVTVQKGDKFFYVNKEGVCVFDSYFSNTPFEDKEDANEIEIVIKDGKYGYINEKGKILGEIKYTEVKPFVNGLAKVTEGEKTYYVIYDANENTLKLYFDAYKGPEPTDEKPIAVVIKDGKYGYINKKGEILGEIKYTDAESFANGVARVTEGEKTYYVTYDAENNKLEYAFDAYKTENPFSNDSPLKAVLDKNGKYGFVDNNGKIVIDFKYVDAYDFADGVAWVQESADATWFTIDKEGTTVDVLKVIEQSAYYHEKTIIKGTAEEPEKTFHIKYYGEPGQYRYGVLNGNNIVVLPFVYDTYTTVEAALNAYFPTQNIN